MSSFIIRSKRDRILLSVRQYSLKSKIPNERGDDPRVHVNSLVFGSPGHGKTTVSSELTKYSHDKFGRVSFKSVAEIDKTGNGNSGSRNTNHMEWDTSMVRVSHTDCPTALPYIKNFLTHISLIDAAIWVINGNEGVLKDAVKQYRLIKHLSNSSRLKIFPILTHESEEDALDLIKLDLKDVLSDEDLGRITTNIHDLASLVQDSFAKKTQDDNCHDQPLIWPVENVGTIPSRGTFIAGRIERGVVRDHEILTAFYRGKTSPVTIRNCEIFRRSCEGYLLPRERGGAYVRIKHESALGLKRGGVLYAPSEDLKVGTLWETTIWSDRSLTVQDKEPLVFIHGTNFDGTCRIVEPLIKLSPREPITIKIKFLCPLIAKQFDRFILKCGDYIYGKLIEVIK